MKKILYIITKSNFGGAQRYVYDLATNLPKEDYAVTVALGGTGERKAKIGTLKTLLEKEHVPTISITNFMRDMSLKNDLFAFFELIKIIRKEKPDVLHVTSSKAGGLGAFVGRLLGVKKIIFTSHGLAYDENWRPSLQRMLIKIASWWTFFFATKTIQLTTDTYERASSLPFMKGKMALVHNGRKSPTFVTKEEARKKLCAQESVCGELWIGTIAELTKNKNLDVLFRALSIVHKTTARRPHVWIISEGEERINLEKLAKELSLEPFIHMIGYVEHASTYLKAFDIFTLPSRKEGLPYVLLEAGLASLPAVVSDIPGIKDIVKHKETGLIVKANAEPLAQALLTLIEDIPLREKYGKALERHVKKTFSIEKMVHDTTRLY